MTPAKPQPHAEHKTLEQEIVRLWKERGLDVTQVNFKVTGDHYTWTVTAKEAPK